MWGLEFELFYEILIPYRSTAIDCPINHASSNREVNIRFISSMLISTFSSPFVLVLGVIVNKMMSKVTTVFPFACGGVSYSVCVVLLTCPSYYWCFLSLKIPPTCPKLLLMVPSPMAWSVTSSARIPLTCHLDYCPLGNISLDISQYAK